MALATAFSVELAMLVNNQGGAIETLPPAGTVTGRRRTNIATVNLAAQASGTVIGLSRLPLYCWLLAITLVGDTSLGTATVALGDTNAAALYLAAQTFTAVNTPTNVGNAATLGAQIVIGYDSVTGNKVTPFMPQQVGQGGANYEDVVMTVGAAALPAAGVLKLFFEYAID